MNKLDPEQFAEGIYYIANKATEYLQQFGKKYKVTVDEHLLEENYGSLYLELKDPNDKKAVFIHDVSIDSNFQYERSTCVWLKQVTKKSGETIEYGAEDLPDTIRLTTIVRFILNNTDMLFKYDEILDAEAKKAKLNDMYNKEYGY